MNSLVVAQSLCLKTGRHAAAIRYTYYTIHTSSHRTYVHVHSLHIQVNTVNTTGTLMTIFGATNVVLETLTSSRNIYIYIYVYRTRDGAEV